MIPVDVDRDEAREAAARELADPVYAAAEPSFVDRIVDWLGRGIAELFTGIAVVGPGGLAGLAVLAVLVALVVVIVRLRTGRIARGARSRPEVFAGRPRSADEHRRAAELAAQRGDLAEAVRERFRAIVRELERRGVLEELSGRTVDEIATQAGLALPGSAPDFDTAARIFDDVVYGDRPATVDGYRHMVTLDDGLLAGAAR